MTNGKTNSKTEAGWASIRDQNQKIYLYIIINIIIRLLGKSYG